MSFSSDLKIELSKINNLKNKQEVYAEFLGYLVTANINIKGKNIKFSTENEYNINRFAKLLNNININDYKINISGKTYNIIFKDDKIVEKLDCKNIQGFLSVDNLKKAYVRGNFLGAGSINNPNNKYPGIVKRNFSSFSLKLEIIISIAINDNIIPTKILVFTIILLVIIFPIVNPIMGIMK